LGRQAIGVAQIAVVVPAGTPVGTVDTHTVTVTFGLPCAGGVVTQCQFTTTVVDPVCGNGVQEGAEACDGGDDGACPGQCLGDCTCPAVQGQGAGPALSEWGALLVVLFGMIAGTFALRRSEARLGAGGAGVMTGRQPMILDRALLGRLLVVVGGLHVLACAAAYAYFGELALRDAIGGALTAGAVAYLLHLWLSKQREL